MNDKIKNNIIHITLGLIILMVFLLPSKVYGLEEGGSISYTGNGTYTAEKTGYYKLEAWGAQGGNARTYHGGYGGYSKGAVLLRKGESIYIVVGKQGATPNTGRKTVAGGYNGGGYGYQYSSSLLAAGGGGATHIATKNATLLSLSGDRGSYNSSTGTYNSKTILIVAGGGSGAYGYSNKWWHGNNGGGYYGGYSYNAGSAGTQTGGYSFGQAGGTASHIERGSTSNQAGGGGGFFGGHAWWGEEGAGGGSGFIGSSRLVSYGNVTKSMWCVGCKTTTSKDIYTTSTGNVSSSAVENYAKSGSGAARVTFLKETNTNAKIDSITIDHSSTKFDPVFDPDTLSYNVTVSEDAYKVNINAIPQVSSNIITGTGEYTLKSGVNAINIVSTTESGDTLIYKLNVYRPPSDYPYLNGITINSKEIENFSPTQLNYTVDIPYDNEEVELKALFGRPNQRIEGEGTIKIPTGISTKKIEVTSEDNSATVTYNITFNREHSSKLKSLKIEGYTISFDPEELEYTVDIMNSTLSLNVDAVAYDEDAKINLSGFGYIKSSTTATITVTEPNTDPTVYKVRIIKGGQVIETTYDYPYRGYIEQFVAPVTGYYRLQTWGAQGGNARSYHGGYGGYSTGVIYLLKDETLYIGVGKQGYTSSYGRKVTAGGYNGGGYANQYNGDVIASGGGGATHIATKKGLLSSLSSNKSSVIIASGGGAGAYGYSSKWWHGNNGGGYYGDYSYNSDSAGTQTSGYSFGQGGGTASHIERGSTKNQAGGGGGFFGGHAWWGEEGAGGGSGYIANSKLKSYKEITKVMYCYDCKTSEDESTYTETTTNYSVSPTSYYAKAGDGYARITLLAQPSENNFLSTITTDKGTLSPTFNMETLDYNVELTSEDDEITIGARLEDDTATLSGIGTFDVPSGTTQFPITVTAENGSIRVYNVNVTRPQSSNEKPVNIVISGLVPSLCMANDKYCKLSNEFSTDVHDYSITVPSRIKQLQFTVIKGHKFQKVSGEGVVSLQGGMNVITIEVMSEDGTNTATYTYNIERDMTGNANIESLEVIEPKVDINFNPDVTDYYFSIPNENTNVDLKIVLEDPEASYEIVGNENFEVGLNIVTINVTAQNGETKTYTLNIYREQSGNTFLSDLTVSHEEKVFDLNPTFNKILSTYTVNVENEIDNIKISATPEHSLTTITGLGNYNLKTGTNTFQVTTTSEDGSVQIYTISVIRAKNSDATLKSLDVLEASLSPEFASDTHEYYIDVNPGITYLNLNVIPNSDVATYKVIGNSGFKVGIDNIVKITVTAENGNKEDYIIHVNRLASTNVYLSYLNTDKYDISSIFDKEKEEYNITVENDITDITVTSTAEDFLSTITGNGKYSLKTGDNSISVTVMAESGDMKTYTLNVYRKYNNNANLISLVTSSTIDYTPMFDKDELNYILEVENAEDKITILGTPEVATSTVSGNGQYQLNVGSNPIDIVVTAEDNTKKTYTITVVRRPSSNANISMLIAKESVLDPVFNKNETNYVLKVIEDVTSLNLSVTLEDSAATYEVIGNENFVIGNNSVIVRVTAEDGTTKDYVLNVLRQARGTTSNRLLNLAVDKGTLSPSFDPDTNYYEVEVPYSVSSITLSGELEDKNATVKGLGTHQLEVGLNPLAVEVTSVEGIVRYYQVVVSRRKNDEARLSNLQVIGTTISPNFNKDTYEYSLSTTLTELNITAVPIDNNATYEVIGNTNLSLGSNQVIVRVTAADGVTTKDYILNVEKEKSNNNNLKSLEVEDHTFTPEFSKTTTVYYLNVERDVETIQVNAIAEDVNATVEGDNEVNLNVGVNYVEVKVTSESGIAKVYTIIVTRKGNNNSYLESLTVSRGSLSPEFEKTENNYTVTVPYEVEEITVSGTLEDKVATAIGFDKYNLEVGTNKIQVTVTAEDGSTNIYSITVTREEEVSSQLKDLTVKNYSLNQTFNKDVYDYNVVIDNEVTSLDLSVVPIDKGATYEIIGNENFIVGMNEVKIVVTDRLGQSSSTYILNVNRQNYANTYLAYIYSSEGTLSPVFDKTILSYTVTVDNNIDSIEISAEPEITSNTLTGTGIYSLNPGDNKIPLTVTTPSGISRTYYVNVVRKLKTNNTLTSLEVKANGETQTLNPTFNANTLNYTVNVAAGTPNVQILATAETGAVISGTGNKMINVGENNFDIVVTAEDGSTKTYTITVNREASSNNNLIDIIPSVGTLSPSFNYSLNEYSLKLDSSASLLSFSVITEDRFATVTGNEVQVIPDNESTRKITVTAEDGSKKVYTIHVYKDRTDEARLASLSINGYTFNETFDKDKFNYTLTVPNSKQLILSSEVKATAVDSNATISKTSSLVLTSTATNIYTVIVTAKDGFTTQTYTISIDREKGSDSTLSKLAFTYGEIQPSFMPTVKEYTLLLPKGVTNISKSDVEAIPTDKDATVILPDTFEFNDSNKTYEIIVESADKSNTTKYIVHLDRLQSNDATLKQITVNTGTLSPTFDRNNLEYSVDVTDKTEEITINAIPNDDKAIILNGVGTHQLDSNSKTISITVQAEDGTIKIYTINVLKSITTEKLLSDMYLEGLCTKQTCPLNPNFSDDNLSYDVTVENEINSIDIKYIKKHENQKVKVYNDTKEEINSDNISLKTGINKFYVEVENGIGEKTNYQLNINRKYSSNNYLEYLKVTDPQIDIEFDKEKTEYYISIPADRDKVTLDYKPEVSTSTVSANGTKYLTPGNNDAFVTVRAEDGSIRTYILHIEREKEYNNYLQSLTISSGTIYNLTPKFNKATTDYVATVPYNASIVTVEAVPEEITTTVVGCGEKTLKVGINTFTITTTAKTGETLNYNIIVNREKSSRLYLKKLEINNATLIETFNKDKFSYNVDAISSITSLDMNIEPEDSTATYKVFGNKNLVTGKNEVLIVLESADKTTTTTYKLQVNKETSTDNYLKSLKVDNKEVITEANYYDTYFNVTFPYDKDIVDITAIASYPLSTIDGLGKYSLDYGDNEINIRVYAEDSSVRTYTLNVKREYDNNLLMISTDRGDLTPTFDKNTLDYYLEVEKEISDITVVGVKSSSTTTLTGNGFYTLNVGENLIKLVVSSSDKTSKTYNVHVTRKKSSNNNLKSLFVHEGMMKENFDKDTLEYNLEVPDNITKLTIDTEVEDSSATYEIIGNDNLVNGNNVVKIKVTAENGDVKTYTLNVLVQDEALFSNKLKSLTVNKGTLAPNFDPDTLSYTVTVNADVSNITLSGILESVDATVVGLGTHELKSGRNEIPIVVTSKDKKTRTYNVIVYRTTSTDPRLKSVTFNEGILSPLFDKDIDTYTMTVDSSVYKLTETIVPLVSGTTYEIIGNENLQTGTTDISIIATAEDKVTKKTYHIKVTKTLSTNNYLDSLSTNIGSILPEFDKTNTGPYIINVDDAVNSLVLSGKPSATTSTVTGLGVHNIVKGKNTINVSVTSEVGTVRTYTVVVNKSLSSDNSLSFLGISDGTLNPEFNSDTLEYNVDVDSLVEEITVLGITNNKNATIKGNGNYSLTDATTDISLVVTAEDGSIKTYTVHVNKEKTASSKLLDIKSQEGILSPEFDKNTYEYTISVPNEVTKLNLDITKEDENATYDIVGNENFIVGSNQVKINVTSTDGKTSTYILNVIRQQNSNNYLKEITLSEGSLTPEFNRTTTYYEVTVDSDVSNIVVNSIAEDSNATIVGNGSKTLVAGDNYIYLKVTSTTGVVRVYTIKVIKQKSSDNLLSSLSVNQGNLQPEFDPHVNNYTLALGEGIDSIDISATANEKATIQGTGTYEVSPSENTYTITVTAEDGSINTYTITATKTSSSNNNITDIIPSSGTLSPNYSNDVNSYEVIVEEDISIIDFDVILESSLAKVSGNKDNYLDYGNNDVVIKVEAEDGSTKEVHINVVREKNITDINVEKDTILMAVGESYQLNPTVLPEDATNKELIYESSNNEVATVENGLITAKKIGDVQITISSAKNSNVKKIVQVTVLNLQLESSVYEVRRDDINIVIGAEEGESLSTFLGNMDNNESLIKFYDNDANQITDLENTRVTTGQLITLEYNNQIYDQAWIVVRGDSSCDSNINVTDYNILVEQVLGKRNLEGYLFSSVDLEEDKTIDVTDSIKLTNYILGKIDSLNKPSNVE